MRIGVLYTDRNGNRDSTTRATVRTIEFIFDATSPITSEMKVLDVGSGNGGSMHKVVQKTGCQAVCFNLCPKQNETNRERIHELGLQDKIQVKDGNFESLPQEWTESFDVVWSQDAIVHSTKKPLVLSELFRVFKPGGKLVFTDIMGS